MVGINLIPAIDDFENYYKQAIVLQTIYKQSIIDSNTYYSTCAQISYKTSNSQEIIEKMPFYVFNNFMVYLAEIIKSENGENSDGSVSDQQKEASKTVDGYKNKAKSMVPKTPNFKTPKI